MSGYHKNQEQYVYDAEATRPNQVPSYAGIAQPSFASQYADAPARLSHEPANVEMPFIPSSTYESRGTGFPAESSFMDAKPHHPDHYTLTESEISKSISPSQGVAGSTLLVHLRTTYDLETEQNKFWVMFGARKCVATLQKLEQDDEYYNYALSVEVPPFPLTNSFDPTMMLKLQMEDRNGQLQSQLNAGRFTFNDMPQYQASPEVARLKRKHSTDYTDEQDYSGHATKRTHSMRFPVKPRSMSGSYSAASVSPLPARSSLSAAYGYGSGYDMTKQTSYTPQLSHQGLYAVPSSGSIAQNDMKPPQMSPNLPTYGQYSSLGQGGRSPASIPVTPTRSTVLSSPSVVPTPVLVRATTLPQSASAPSSQAFNPYLMYPTKAVLKIEGDLDSMVDGWTQDERDAQRRLVEFKRSQSGSTITTSFAPITLETRQQRSICVSCIYWEEKDECFITSVDTIYLLEQLVNVRFTVEEKNRIRRNLEGFRPLTVSKAKSDSEEFFKVIMGFPNPKPRNIEKDVKVFPWKILAHALKKIISKYTANYSSTAGAGSHPVGSSSYVQVPISQTTGDVHRNTSPRSLSSSVASAAYTPNIHSTSHSPNLRTSAGMDPSASHNLSIAPRGPAGQVMSQWGTASRHQVPQYATGLTQGRESWDYGYLQTHPATGVPAAAQPMQMQRSDVTPDLNQISADNPYQQYGQRTTRV
ncbi:hypothetical protein BU23DRAFT_29008 [Bimuria novae-zelandiae CBS 107.79]|uniref:DUF7082 domain-containing protein n=1 Tax=Bimuria novae-zelandiae CBS 107.79 TaxID=1447943 RepID=A0A6A5VJD2_9PLEO|nr:hypothetical protein BU23DRAFT_29008 [Bimuria novae-zelandiae CBS 107.79]